MSVIVVNCGLNLITIERNLMLNTNRKLQEKALDQTQLTILFFPTDFLKV